MTRLMTRSLLALVLSATALTPLSVAAQTPPAVEAALPLPVRDVTLSAAGVAQFVREIEAGPGLTRHALTVDLGEVDDLLKSLALSGEGLISARIRLAGEDPAGDVFARLPFAPHEIGRLEALLAAFPGTPVTADTVDGPVTGQVMGVAPGEGCAETTDCPARLLLLAGDGQLVRVPLTPETTVTLLDPEARAQIARGLGSLAAASQDRVRTLVIEVDRAAEATGPVYLTHVAAAPVWKTTWRAEVAEDGTASVQAWAVIENATGEDWQDVALTLSSGAPRLLHQALHARLWPAREELPVFVPDTRSRIGDAPAFGAMAAPMMLEEAAPAPMMAPLETGATTDEGDVDARFAFGAPVSLAAGQMLSLPFLDEELSVRRVVTLTGGGAREVARHPEFALDIENTLAVRMPGGIVTVHEAARGHVGDAAMPDLGPGQRGLVTFATDRKMSVTEQVGPVLSEERITLRDGVIVFEGRQSRGITYAVSGAEDGARLLILDHPLASGWTLTALDAAADWRDEGEDVPAGRARFEVPLDAGSDVTLALTETRPVVYSYALTDATTADLRIWGEGQMSDADRAALDALLKLRQEEDDLRGEFDRAQAARGLALEEQERVRLNLGAVPETSQAHQRYLDRLLALEDEIAAAEAEVARLTDALEAKRAEVEAFIAGL